MSVRTVAGRAVAALKASPRLRAALFPLLQRNPRLALVLARMLAAMKGEHFAVRTPSVPFTVVLEPGRLRDSTQSVLADLRRRARERS